jgi:hypothetical protein
MRGRVCRLAGALVVSGSMIAGVGWLAPASAAAPTGFGVARGSWTVSSFESPPYYDSGPYQFVGTWPRAGAAPFAGTIRLSAAHGTEYGGKKIYWYRPAYVSGTGVGGTLSGRCVYRPNQLFVADCTTRVNGGTAVTAVMRLNVHTVATKDNEPCHAVHCATYHRETVVGTYRLG